MVQRVKSANRHRNRRPRRLRYSGVRLVWLEKEKSTDREFDAMAPAMGGAGAGAGAGVWAPRYSLQASLCRKRWRRKE